MELSRVVPVDRIEAALGSSLEVTRLQTAHLQQILQRNSSDLFGIAASTWHRIATGGRLRVDPMQMRRHFENEDVAGLTRAIERVVRQPMIKEFGFLQATVQHSRRDFVVATSCVAHLFFDELHLYDIAMADPKHPIPPRAQKCEIQHHRGFNLLPEVLANVLNAGRERGCSMVTLTAAFRPLVDVFSRHGFAVENNSFAQQAMSLGVSIPMEAAL